MSVPRVIGSKSSLLLAGHSKSIKIHGCCDWMVRGDIIEGDFCQRIHPPQPQHHRHHQVAAWCVDQPAKVVLGSGEEKDPRLVLCDCCTIRFLWSLTFNILLATNRIISVVKMSFFNGEERGNYDLFSQNYYCCYLSGCIEGHSEQLMKN